MSVSKFNFFAVSIVCCVVASAATAYVMHRLLADDGLKIAVIEYGKVIESISTDTPDEKRDEIMGAVQTQIRKLGAAGYLVLNGNAVLYMPEAMRVPVPKLSDAQESSATSGSVAGVAGK